MANDNNKKVSLTGRVASSKPAPAKKAAPAKKNSGGAVNLTQRAASQKASAKKTKKKKAPVGKIVMYVLMALLIVLCVVLLLIVAPFIRDLFGNNNEQTPNVPSGDLIGYVQSSNENVSYYVVGLFGEDLEQQMDALSIVCYDRKAGTVDVMQVPTDTYLNADSGWAEGVHKIGNLWANPKNLVWCAECAKQVFEAEIRENTHSVCGAMLTTQKGSSQTDLMRAFNVEYSLPVDNYYLFQRGSLKETIDYIGGLDIVLEEDMTLAETEYPAGKQTLDGAAVLEYITYTGDSVSGDVQHQLDTRAVWVALFDRLAQLDAQTMYDDVISNVQVWDNPIKMQRVGDYWETDAMELCELIVELGKLDRKNFTFHMMPGEASQSGGVTYYSVHKDDLAALLQAEFNPYGDEIGTEDLMAEELSNTTASETVPETFAALAVKQSGELE